MLIAGAKVNSPPKDVVILPRAEGNLIFHIIGVPTFSPFDDMCPRPKPPRILKRGQQMDNLDDPTFRKQWDDWAQLRQDWLLINSLDVELNEITWEEVDPKEPSTWSKVNDELLGAGLTQIELNRLIERVYEVNALSERGMEQARANFLQMMSLETGDE